MSNLSNILASNLREKDDMKVSLSHSDSDTVQYVFFRKEKVVVKVAEIKITQNAINNSFYLNHARNSKLDDTTLRMDDMRTELTSVTLTDDI